MSYIQNKLDEFRNIKLIDGQEADGIMENSKMLSERIEQAITDYHNHIVEKWEHDIKLLKLIHKQELDSIALKSLEDFMEWSELRKSLQDTNPKE